ncbi:EFR1 family ferrodoxin [Clostridium sp.]|jgi:ferredoxin|uniref:EFR1 family ferrodoxin n=1 Tax=Clostridium sp. TaxID=1506 RepID=UPI003EEAAC7A
MKTVILYCFSGSGNTFKVATKVRDIFEKLDYKCELERIEDVEYVNLKKYEYVGLLFPVAIQSTFPIVWEFIEGLPKTQGQKIFMIDTMEQFSGGIVGPVKKVLQAKGYDCVAALEVKMTSSMQAKKMNIEEGIKKNTKAIKSAGNFVKEMLNGKRHWPRVPLLSDWMRGISKGRKIWTTTSEKIGINHDQCVRCGICIRKCPVKAIQMIDGKVMIDHSICNSCMRCVHHCPKNAFNLNGKEVFRLNFD